MSELCPCGSNAKYSDCCELIHSNLSNAKTAESLMRARYSAFVKNKISFIIDSHDPGDRDTQDESEISKWAEESEWLGLEIIKTEKGLEKDNSGKVEFTANYKMTGRECNHHELSQFKKIDGNWYFCEGKILQDVLKREGPKVGRNEPCPCGSGKKYKKCCL